MSDQLTPTCILTEDNFDEWLGKTKALLCQKKLWEFCQEPIPTKNDTCESRSKDTEDEKTLEEKHKEAADYMVQRISASVLRKLSTTNLSDGYLLLTHLTDLLPTAEVIFTQ